MDLVGYGLMFVAVLLFIVGCLALCVRWTLAMFAPDTRAYLIARRVSEAGCAASFLIIVVLLGLLFLASLVGL